MYIGLKYTHIVFVSISMVLFQYRYYLKTSNKPHSKHLKIIPHINDTLLLITGVSLAIITEFNPIHQPWLMAKIVALFAYIGFSMITFKSTGIKSILAYILATLTFGFIVLSAFKKAPFLFGT